jgi:hypothetical protein
MRSRLRSLATLLLFAFALAACETTNRSANSGASGERAKLIEEVCALINASGGRYATVSAQKFNGPSAYEGVATKLDKRFSSQAKQSGPNAIEVQVTDHSEVITEYLRPRISFQQPAPYRATSVGKWTIPLERIASVTVNRMHDADSPSSLTRSNFGGGYVAANEVVTNCHVVGVALSRNVRYENRHSNPELSWSKPLKGGAVAYFDSREKADRLAADLRRLVTTAQDQAERR